MIYDKGQPVSESLPLAELLQYSGAFRFNIDTDNHGTLGLLPHQQLIGAIGIRLKLDESGLDNSEYELTASLRDDAPDSAHIRKAIFEAYPAQQPKLDPALECFARESRQAIVDKLEPGTCRVFGGLAVIKSDIGYKATPFVQAGVWGEIRAQAHRLAADWQSPPIHDRLVRQWPEDVPMFKRLLAASRYTFDSIISTAARAIISEVLPKAEVFAASAPTELKLVKNEAPVPAPALEANAA